MSVLFCFGLGYTAGFLARRLKAEGWEVRGTTRDRARLAGLEDAGFLPFLFGRDRPLDHPAKALAGVTHVLHSVPPDPEGDPVLDRHGDDLRALGDGLAWVGYLGTTAVYGDRGGDWVGEDDAPAPTLERARRRAAAEAAWRASGLPVHVFRLAGIYGPGRSALDRVRAKGPGGKAHRIDLPGQVFSRVHVDDIASGVMAAMTGDAPRGAYNLADDLPCSQNAVIEEACRLLGVEPPPLQTIDEAGLSPMARGFYAENRRVANGKARRVLGWQPRYPTYREGLRSLL